MLSVLELCRPKQWAKNVFVLAPLLFSQQLLSISQAGRAALAFAAFCLASSAVYIFNDLLDVEADRTHPRKRNRPIASGRVSARSAGLLCVGLLAGAVGFGLPLAPRFLALLGLYLANSVLYCVYVKNKVIADVMAIAAGFVLRLLAGCAAIGVEASSWILVCGFSLALVLGFGKRRAEVAQFGGKTETRPALVSYDVPKLDMLLAISTAVTLLSYMLYSVAPETVERHKTANLIYGVPIVAYGLFRYLFKTQEGAGDGPTEILLEDWVFPLVGAAWAATVGVILYWEW